MPDSDRNEHRTISGSPVQYLPQGGPATPGLADRIAARIRRGGPLAFPDFMAAALYDPEDGYYARHTRQVGGEGDFFTSVSVGPLFGRLLARHIDAWHESAGRPRPWRIVELGAHDGTLAADILEALMETPAAEGLEYAIIEPLPRLAAAQRERLCGLGTGVAVHPDAAPLAADPRPGFLFANEVLDALPFHVIESDGAGWRELGVALDESGAFRWETLGPFPTGLPVRPAGYRTEARSCFGPFFRSLAACLSRGRMLWIDYGFARADYYHEARTEGTLRTFRRHRAGDDPLEEPGGRDITAHVDFTAAAEALRAAGGEIVRFEDQARFLTRTAGPWLLSLEGLQDEDTRKQLRAFQTLIHPAHLGSRFHVLEASWGEGIAGDEVAWAKLVAE